MVDFAFFTGVLLAVFLVVFVTADGFEAGLFLLISLSCAVAPAVGRVACVDLDAPLVLALSLAAPSSVIVPVGLGSSLASSLAAPSSVIVPVGLGSSLTLASPAAVGDFGGAGVTTADSVPLVCAGIGSIRGGVECCPPNHQAPTPTMMIIAVIRANTRG